MSDILSQEEVDALLSAVAMGSIGVDNPPPERRSGGGSVPLPSDDDADDLQRPVALYDFKRPDRVSKEQLRTLQNLHEGYARLFSTTLTSFLRTLVEIELVSVDQLTYQEVIMSISSPSCIYVFQLEPLEGSALMEVNPSLIFLMLDRLFGGQGRNTDQSRELTDIERSVMNKIIERALIDLKIIWENIGIFSPKIDSYETNPQFVQIAPPGETVILISLEVRMKNGSGLISLCFPFILLESIIEKLSGETWIAAQKTTTQETRRLVEKELSETDVQLAAQIGSTEITVRDFLQLEKSDVLVLDKLAISDLVLNVGGKPKYLAKPGVVGRKKSVQITSIIERNVGDYDG
jgi:flagellar motor switch protein FliM